jgi:hypothetical protein
VSGSRKFRLKSIDRERNELLFVLFMINFLGLLYPTALLTGTHDPINGNEIYRIP